MSQFQPISSESDNNEHGAILAKYHGDAETSTKTIMKPAYMSVILSGQYLSCLWANLFDTGVGGCLANRFRPVQPPGGAP